MSTRERDVELATEIKRKVFHHLSLVYMLAYLVLPRPATLTLFLLALLMLGSVEFIRIRRPELNAWFLKKFGGIHRPTEIMSPSGIFWTLLGCWATIVIFPSQKIVLPALGFLVFGDTAAALVGKRWGRRPWPMNVVKTYEGSAAMAGICFVWALFWVRWPVAFLGSLAAAWIEARKFPWNDNLWIPLCSGLVVSLLNLFLGRG